MSPVVRQRHRIVRVRTVQHNLAAAAASKAQADVRALEHSADRLGALRGALEIGTGTVNGATLASMGELAMRLDSARGQLSQSISGARLLAARREEVRVARRRDQESADRLKIKAERAVEALAERKRPASRGPRSRFTNDDER